ncbi:MAG TPA: XRE family transcriptional regulator [Puia sp.]|nr:XRE family transcriptional regulator [Puia sp.]
MHQANPKMIEIARQSRGYTQKELASLLPNISQPNLSKIEKGLQPLSEENLKSISVALRYPIDFFYREGLRTPFSNIYFRKRTTVSQRSLDLIFSDVYIILLAIDDLISEVELREYAKYTFDFSDGWTAESIASRLREIMDISSGPIKNLVEVIEEEGIVLYFYDTAEEKFDGLTAYTNKGIPVIFINKNMPNDRIRFTLCHELAHLVAHIPCDVEPWRDVEHEANDIASAILMPKTDCLRDLKLLSYNKLTGLKAYWGVSKAAIIRRAKTLGAINEATYKYLMIELGRRGERKAEAGFVELDDPKTVIEVIDLLKTKLNHTDDIIAENMALETIDFAKYFEPTSTRIKVRSIRRAI